ncbi:hypothetical protein Tco_0439089 [Tanacetum coccineum]
MKVCKTTKERILKDHWRERFGDEEDDIEKNLKDPEECREDKANVIMGSIHDKLNDDWFNGTSEYEDDLEGILDYLEPRSYDGLIDLDYEAYNKRKTRDNVAAIKVGLMEKMAKDGSGQAMTFSQQGNGIQGLPDSFSCGIKKVSVWAYFGYAVTDVYRA